MAPSCHGASQAIIVLMPAGRPRIGGQPQQRAPLARADLGLPVARSRCAARCRAGGRNQTPARIPARSQWTPAGTGPSAAAPAQRYGPPAPGDDPRIWPRHAATGRRAGHHGPPPSRSGYPTWSPAPSSRADTAVRMGPGDPLARAGTFRPRDPASRRTRSGRPSGAGTSTRHCRSAQPAPTPRSQTGSHNRQSGETGSRLTSTEPRGPPGRADQSSPVTLPVARCRTAGSPRQPAPGA